MSNRDSHKRLEYFLSQPHQPFFLLGIVSAIIFMALFLLSYRGILPTNPTLLHSYSMIFIVFTNFFYGFTLTTFPRFSSQKPIEQKRYLTLYIINLIAFISLVAMPLSKELFFASSISMAISLSYLIKIFYGIYRESQHPKSVQYMIIFSFGMGALSNLLFILSQISCSKCNIDILFQYGIQIGIYLYMLLLAIVIAFKMVPFFSRILYYEKSRYLHPALITLLTLHVITAVSFKEWVWLVDLLLTVMIIYEIIRMDLPFPNSEALLWGLHLAIFWLGFAFLISSMVEFFEAYYNYNALFMPIHILMLGFLTSILIAFITRVTLGHGGVAILKSTKFTQILFIFVQIVVIIRVMLSLTAPHGKIFPLFDISITAWIVMFIWWFLMYGRILIFGNR